jgi:hypothetical protein
MKLFSDDITGTLFVQWPMFYNPAQGIIRRIDHAEVEPRSIRAEGQPQVPSYATVQAKPHEYFDQSAGPRGIKGVYITEWFDWKGRRPESCRIMSWIGPEHDIPGQGCYVLNAAIVAVPILILAAASWKPRCAVNRLNETLTTLKRREVLIRIGITAWSGNNIETKFFCLMAGITRRR